MESEGSRRANEETRAAWNQNAALWDARMGERGSHPSGIPSLSWGTKFGEFSPALVVPLHPRHDEGQE